MPVDHDGRLDARGAFADALVGVAGVFQKRGCDGARALPQLAVGHLLARRGCDEGASVGHARGMVVQHVDKFHSSDPPVLIRVLDRQTAGFQQVVDFPTNPV